MLPSLYTVCHFYITASENLNLYLKWALCQSQFVQYLSCIYTPCRYTQTASFTLWSSPLVSPSLCFSWVSLSYLNVNSLRQGLFPVVCRTLTAAVEPESLFLAEQGSTYCMMCPPWRCLHKAHCKSHPSGANYCVTK